MTIFNNDSGRHMDTQKDSLKGLPSAVVLSTVFYRELKTLNILALYAPGVTACSGVVEQIVRWVVALHLCRGGQRVFSALAFKSLGHAGVCDMYLQAFQGASEVYALDRNHLLQALGLADDRRLIHDPGWVKLQSHVRPVENEVRDFTSSPSFFDETLALKCATVRAARLAAKRK